MCYKCKKLEGINKDQIDILSSLKGTLDYKNTTINCQNLTIKSNSKKASSPKLMGNSLCILHLIYFVSK